MEQQDAHDLDSTTDSARLEKGVVAQPKQPTMKIGSLFCHALAGIWMSSAASHCSAQPPERFRLDFSMGAFARSGTRGFMGGVFAPTTTALGQSDLVSIFDGSGVLNITERLYVGAGIPFGFILKPKGQPGLSLEDFEFGIGDVHAEAGYHLFSEREYLPGVEMGAEMGAPTADNLLLGVGLWRSTGRLTLSKNVSRITLFLDGSYSHYFDDGETSQDVVITYGGGVGFGLSKAWRVTLQVGEAFGGERTEKGNVTIPETHDLRAGVGFTKFSEGRPRFTFFTGAGRLNSGEPTFLLTLRWALLSF